MQRLINPTLVVEVLSKSTEAYDRSDKLARYLALPSVAHVMFVSAPRRTSHRGRAAGTWRYLFRSRMAVRSCSLISMLSIAASASV